ncbi:MAG: Membrane-associated phospholipid phosphatase [Chloroflexi bacterium]|nr:MAG: Membrane-associated phospholipid phosphatase [Chloroflexota bacterium]
MTGFELAQPPAQPTATPRFLRRPSMISPRPSMIWVSGVIGATALILLAALAIAVGPLPAATDLSIARAIQDVNLPGWDSALALGEWLTGAPGGVIIWLLLVAGLWLWSRPVESIAVALSAGIWLPKAILEELVARPRPTDDLLLVTQLGDGFAFPSGHITAGAAVFGMLAVIAIVRLPTWRSRAWVLAPVATILTLASLSRVESGAHWPTDVAAALLLATVWLLGMTWVYLELRSGHAPGLCQLRALRRRLRHRRRPIQVPQPGSPRITGSIASTVYLDDAAGLARKVYNPSLPVRALYWAAFQAPFPYATREPALRTAAAVRELTGLLTRYWTGDDLVARVTAIRRRGEQWELESELVQGREPANNAEIRDQLIFLRRRFAQAGLPTWQIDIENPHAHTNLIRRPDGRLRIIDLESTLVPLIQPLARWPQMLRDGRAPIFDDVDYVRLRAYIAAEHDQLAAALGPDLDRLLQAIDVAQTSALAWKSAEPAI